MYVRAYYHISQICSATIELATQQYGLVEKAAEIVISQNEFTNTHVNIQMHKYNARVQVFLFYLVPLISTLYFSSDTCC